MKIVFMGTPDFSVPALLSLIEAGHEISGVVTQPDKPKGRGKEIQVTPVKEVALKHNIPVYQPVHVKNNPEFLAEMKRLQPDAIVVIAFGQILPLEILNLPRYGCINIHASLLPKYRGAAPIQWSIIDGEEVSGITTMYMEEGLDTGDILLKEIIPISEEETGGSLFDKLAAAGGPLILETLKGLEAGVIERTPQRGTSSYASILTKEMGNIDWSKDAVSIERLIRGLSPWPSAYSHINGKTVKIWKAKVVESADIEMEDDLEEEEAFGKIVQVSKDRVLIRTGKDYLSINELQLEGKKRMEISAFLRGYELKVGDRFTVEK